MNGARENREAVSQTFPFSPIYNNSSILPDCGFGSYMPSPLNDGSPVLYKSPVQHGKKRTDRSKFATADGNEHRCDTMPCVKRIVGVLKVIHLESCCQHCWLARNNSTVNDLTMKEDCMLYIIVAITAVFTVLITLLIKNMGSSKPSNIRKWNIDNSSICRRRVQGLSPSLNPKYRQEHHYSYSPIVPDTPLDRNRQATAAPMRSSEVSPSGILNDERKPSTGETDWTATSSLSIARSSVCGHLIPEGTEWRSHVSIKTIERSGIQTATEVRSSIATPQVIKSRDLNTNQVESETGIHEGTTSCKLMDSKNEKMKG